MSAAPAVYVGTLRHRRFVPKPHAFTYSLFMVCLDIDHLREAMQVSRFTSYNGRNLAVFDDRDHFGDPSRPMRQRLHDAAAASGVTLPDGPILLLTHLRYAGYVFNPISLFYCHDSAGALRTVLAEVNNTYGGRHLYWLAPDGARATGSPFRATTQKMLYVSPFMRVEGHQYEFALTAPGPTLTAHVTVNHAARPGDDPAPRYFDATLTLRRRPWSAPNVHAALLRFPFMTARVTAAIHWEALKLYLKGVPVTPRMETL